MKPYLRTVIVTLLISFVCAQEMSSRVLAATAEERQGVSTEAPAQPQAGHSPNVIMLGDSALPAEVLEKLTPKQITEILKRQATQPRTTAEIIFNEAVLVPGIVFSSFAVVSIFVLYFSFRKRREMLDTVRTVIQSGQTLPATFLEALEPRSKPTPESDLRKAVLLIALGLSGMGVLAALADDEGARIAFIGLVPTLLGVGYLFLWLQSQKKRKAGSNDEPR